MTAPAAKDSNMTRADHLQWCKDRAFEYLDRNDVTQAWASFASDMSKHDETKDHAALMLGAMGLMSGQYGDPASMRKFIEGFD